MNNAETTERIEMFLWAWPALHDVRGGTYLPTITVLPHNLIQTMDMLFFVQPDHCLTPVRQRHRWSFDRHLHHLTVMSCVLCPFCQMCC